MVTKKELEEAPSFQLAQITKENKENSVRLEVCIKTFFEKRIIQEKNEIFNEMMMRREKEKNIMIFGLTESKDEDIKDEIGKLLDDISVPEGKLDIKTIKRIGNAMPGKIRPVKAEFHCVYTAQKIKRNSKELKALNRKVWIQEDLTTKQLDDYKKLKEDAVKKNDEKVDLNNDEKWIVVGRRSNPYLKKVKKEKKRNTQPSGLNFL